MDANKYNREVGMQCPTCGGAEFKFDEDHTDNADLVECTGCGLKISRAELVEANSENIDAQVEEIADAAVKDVADELMDTLKRTFADSRNIKIR